MLVSKKDHCLADLLQRHKRDESQVDIPVIISNHETCASWAQLFNIPFVVCPVTKETKPQQEHSMHSLLKRDGVELVVMARYMQTLSASFLAQVGCPAINIHHSFLPAFGGANPYLQAFDRGEKIIGQQPTMQRRICMKAPLSKRMSSGSVTEIRLMIL